MWRYCCSFFQVHHGGAGTTAAGLKTAVIFVFEHHDIPVYCLILNDNILDVFQCPTTVIPFFGDQPFWGERVHARGVGPAPIPVDEFSLEKLVAAIRFMLDPKVASLFLVFYLLCFWRDVHYYVSLHYYDTCCYLIVIYFCGVRAGKRTCCRTSKINGT